LHVSHLPTRHRRLEGLAVWLNAISPVLLGLGLLALFIEFKTPGFGLFGIPGIGRYFVEGALNRDYTLVMGTVVVVAVFVLVFNLLVDLVYALIVPRVRYE